MADATLQKHECLLGSAIAIGIAQQRDAVGILDDRAGAALYHV